jgi:hypothetical protein
MNGASVRPAHWIAFAIHPDDHEARPGHASSLTKRSMCVLCARVTTAITASVEGW